MNVLRLVVIAAILGGIAGAVLAVQAQDTERKASHTAQVAKAKECKPQALYCKRS